MTRASRHGMAKLVQTGERSKQCSNKITYTTTRFYFSRTAVLCCAVLRCAELRDHLKVEGTRLVSDEAAVSILVVKACGQVQARALLECRHDRSRLRNSRATLPATFLFLDSLDGILLSHSSLPSLLYRQASTACTDGCTCMYFEGQGERDEFQNERAKQVNRAKEFRIQTTRCMCTFSFSSH